MLSKFVKKILHPVEGFDLAMPSTGQLQRIFRNARGGCGSKEKDGPAL
jgi:hypothetical protein